MSDITFEYVTEPGDSITFELTDMVTLPPGGGAVDSVNGQTGTVVLDAEPLFFDLTGLGPTYALDLSAVPDAVKSVAVYCDTAIALTITQPVDRPGRLGLVVFVDGAAAISVSVVGGPVPLAGTSFLFAYLEPVAGFGMQLGPYRDPAVASVNGQTGVVVLDADDIGDGTTNKAYTAAEQTKLAAISGTNTGDQTLPTLSSLGAVPTSRTLAGLDLSADRTASALRTALGLVIGTDVAAQSSLAAKADLASPALTGSPTAPTQTAADNSTKLATTAYADTAAAFAKPHMTYAGAYQASTTAMVASTITSFAAVNYEGYVPMFLVAGTYDRVGLYTTVAAVSTWEMGLYSVGASGQPTSQITSFGSLDMNATAGLNLITLAPLTVYATAWYYVGIKITAFTASPTLHRMPNTSVPAFPGWPIRETVGEAWSWLKVTTGAASGALPSTAPAIGTGSGQAAYANLAPRVLFRKA